MLVGISLRRRRRAIPSLGRKSVEMSDVESATPHRQFPEALELSSGVETMPSQAATELPSRQISLAVHSTRPPTYCTDDDNDSLLPVEEMDEGKSKG